MVFELHIWGPAFGLPSIDPDCTAAVAYFNRIVPQGQWLLVADYDTSISPQGEFPLLIDGNVKITGFTNIVSYLRNHHSGAYDLDYHLSHSQQTDRTAYDLVFATFLHSTAGPLTDLSLFVSSENYNSTTSSAYTAILPWYKNYIIPPRRRESARARTAHLGLSSLDVSEASQDDHGPGSGTASSEYEAAKRAAGIPTDTQPKTLNMGHGKGIGGLLSSPIYAARFKLDGLSNELLEPLSDLLGKKEYLLEGDKPSSLDCLAFGFLALMLYPPVPQPWLKKTIQSKYPRISRYTRRLRDELLGNEDIDAADVWSVVTSQANVGTIRMRLPWAPRESKAFISHAVAVVSDALISIPILSSIGRHSTIIQHKPEASSKGVPSSLPSPLAVNTLAAFSAVFAAGLTALAVHHRRSPRDGPLIFWALRPHVALNAFGTESFLGVLASQLPKRV